MDMQIITTDGQFDARKARQLLYEFSRDNAIVNRCHALSIHLGLSSEESYLLAAVHLAAALQGMEEMLLRDLETRIPTLYMRPTKDGPFTTEWRP